MKYTIDEGNIFTHILMPIGFSFGERFKSIMWVIFFLFFSIVEGNACQPTDEWQQQSNYELVKEANFIVLAKVVSKLDKKNRYGLPLLETEVIKVIKGNFKEKKLFLEGVLTYHGRTAEDDFSKVRDGVYLGRCYPYDYKLNSTFLLFLDKRGRLLKSMFSRVNEEVNSFNSPWVKAVSFYVKIGSLNDYGKEKIALEEAFETKSTMDALKKDITKHFKMINQYKSTQDLIEMYKSTKNIAIKYKILWAFINKNDNSYSQIFEELLSNEEWLNYVSPVTKYLEKSKAKNRIELLINGYNKIVNKAEEYDSTPSDILNTIGRLATKKDEKIIVDLLESNASNYVHHFTPWLIKYPSEDLVRLVKLVYKKNQNNTYYKWTLVQMGDDEMLNWAKNNRNKDIKDKWMVYYTIAMSPLDEADRLVKEIIKSDVSKKDLISIIQGYNESTNWNKSLRLKEIMERYGTDKEVRYWIKRSR